MERWRGRVAVVTGASAGIGAAIAYQLQDAGLDVVALARRKDKIEAAVENARKDANGRGRKVLGKAPVPGKLHCLKCDVSKEEDIISAFKWVKENTKGVDIMINNAGVPSLTTLTETNTADWKKVFDINLMGLSIGTREAIQQMRATGTDDGHVIHISSIAGHIPVISGHPRMAMYSASKHAVRVLTEGLRKELVAAKSKIRVTEISPGLVKTEILDNLEGFDLEEIWKRPHLFPEDIADTVLYVLGAPAHVQIHEMIVLPNGEDF